MGWKGGAATWPCGFLRVELELPSSRAARSSGASADAPDGSGQPEAPDASHASLAVHAADATNAARAGDVGQSAEDAGRADNADAQCDGRAADDGGGAAHADAGEHARRAGDARRANHTGRADYPLLSRQLQQRRSRRPSRRPPRSRRPPPSARRANCQPLPRDLQRSRRRSSGILGVSRAPPRDRCRDVVAAHRDTVLKLVRLPCAPVDLSRKLQSCTTTAGGVAILLNPRFRLAGSTRSGRTASVAMRDGQRPRCAVDQSPSEVLTGIIGARRACTVSMISPLSMPWR